MWLLIIVLDYMVLWTQYTILEAIIIDSIISFSKGVTEGTKDFKWHAHGHTAWKLYWNMKNDLSNYFPNFLKDASN